MAIALGTVSNRLTGTVHTQIFQRYLAVEVILGSGRSQYAGTGQSPRKKIPSNFRLRINFFRVPLIFLQLE